MSQTPLLDTINLPQNPRRPDKKQLLQIVAELRAFLLDSISKTGGHFVSNLGMVELIIVLHYVYDTSEDKLVWDVGHRSYPHKVLIDRKDQMHTIRCCGGLAGFPKHSESEYDAFGVGHSSTSIGAALGMAAVDKLLGSDRRSAAIIGDDAIVAGQAFEALGYAGDMGVNLLVILNDNEMSTSPNVGALSKHLASNIVRDMYGVLSTIKAQSNRVLGRLPGTIELTQKVEHEIKTLASEVEHAKRSLSLFEDFGLRCAGPVDGHSAEHLVNVLKDLHGRKGPQLLHVVTKKGNGYKLAENDPVKYHVIANLSKDVPDDLKAVTSSGEESKSAAKLAYMQVFDKWPCDQAAVDSRLAAITPTMHEGSGLVELEQQFPDRYLDIGIVKRHAVTFAGGLVCEDMKPVVTVYPTFLQRVYDQLVHNTALQNLSVLFVADCASTVGVDDLTHADLYDLSFLHCVSNMITAAPSDENECRLLPSTHHQANTPAAVHHPRGTGTGAPVSDDLETVAIDKGTIRRQSEKTAFTAFGSMAVPASAVAEKLNAAVADVRFAKPIDEELTVRLAQSHDYTVTAEENVEQGDADDVVLEVLVKHGICKPVLLLGAVNTVTERGDSKKLLDDLGSSTERIE